MKQQLSQLMIEYRRKWQQQTSPILKWGVLVAVLAVYYALILLPSDYAVTAMKKSTVKEQKQIDWMVMAGKELQRLKSVAPQKKIETSETAFALVNQSIDKREWNSLVNEVRQVDQDRVQVTFKSVSFDELISWLQSLYAKGNVYPVEATLKKQQIGVVSASLILQQE